MSDDTKALIERMEAARDFPANTCGASRHAQEVAEQLIEGRLIEPELAEHVGESIAATVAALWEARTKIARLEAERDAVDKLAAFGAWAADEFRDSLGDVDGGSAQDAMERFGVIVKRTVTEPCGEACVCADYGEFPHDCYVFPEAIRAAMQGKP